MNEILEPCHLCGADMGSRAPICPKCFARSDPTAREAIRLERERVKAEQARLEAQELAWQQAQSGIAAQWLIAILAIVVAALLISSCIRLWQTVQLEAGKKDRWGRTLGAVNVDGKPVAEAMVARASPGTTPATATTSGSQRRSGRPGRAVAGCGQTRSRCRRGSGGPRRRNARGNPQGGSRIPSPPLGP
jgi:hypothetical protein